MKYLLIFLLMFSQVCHADGDATHLMKGDSAPFSGYLITEDKAQKIHLMDLDLESNKKVNDLLTSENAILAQRLDNSRKENDDLVKHISTLKSDNFFDKIGYFVLGAAVTTLIAYGTVRTLR